MKVQQCSAKIPSCCISAAAEPVVQREQRGAAGCEALSEVESLKTAWESVSINTHL